MPASIFTAVGSFFSTVWPYLVAVLLFLFMIVIHEFGHFIAAKAMGVRVNEFSVGFGPTIFKKQGKETLYSLRLIPFGGYCAMEGEDEESGDTRAFCNKPAWRRFIIIVAGAFFNLVFGLIIVMMILAPADRFITTTVSSFHENSLSEKVLEPGDKIVSINGRKIYSAYDLSYCLSNVEGDTLDFIVKRDGQKIEVKPQFKTETIKGINYVAVDFYVEAEQKTFTSFISQSFSRTFSYARIVWFSLVDLITGKYGISAVSGPVGVTAVIGTAAKAGLTELLPIIALITVNLGVFNLLPVPALDGGRAFFLIVEMIIRKPIPKKAEAIVHTAGLILLLGFIAIVTLKDIIGFF